MSKKTKSNKQELAKQEAQDPIKAVIAKPDDKIQQSDVHKFLETLRQDDLEFDADYKAVKLKYHECYDSEIGLRVKVGEAQTQNELVKTSRAEVADKLHPVIVKLRATVPDLSKHKMAMCISNILRDQEGKKEAEAKGLSVSNITAILKIYVAKYGLIFEQTTTRKTKEHGGGTARTFDIDIDDTEIINDFISKYNEAVANGIFSSIRLVIDEHYDLQKIQVVTSDTQDQAE